MRSRINQWWREFVERELDTSRPARQWPGMVLAVVVLGAVLLARGCDCGGLDRRSTAELGFDEWARRTGKAVRSRTCYDEAPASDGMVRCEASFAVAGRGVVWCPGDRSAETTCRWTR
jgi:hypothetical protein